MALSAPYHFVFLSHLPRLLTGAVHLVATLFRQTHKVAGKVLRNVSRTFLTRISVNLSSFNLRTSVLQACFKLRQIGFVHTKLNRIVNKARIIEAGHVQRA